MTSKADRIVRDALRLTGDQRARYLDLRCGSDARLRAEVEAALRGAVEPAAAPRTSGGSVASSSSASDAPAASTPPASTPPPATPPVSTPSAPTPTPAAAPTSTAVPREPPERDAASTAPPAPAPVASPDIPTHAPTTETAGAQIGRYRLLEVLGEGGFGTVWMAEQREPVRRRVALKLIKLGMDTKQVIARFDAERQALAMMEHPNIAKVLDAGSTDAGRPYFVMEYIRGVPVLDYCDSARLDTRARLDLFANVCNAIQHAHQKGVIHRDIKPSNVLVTLHDGVPVPKVIDFGVAKATAGDLTQRTLFTEHRQMLGTPAYMSPEQAEMSGLDVDTRSDVYSLGVLLYELLTGTTPFDMRELLSKGYSELMRVIREVEPHRPSTRVSRLTTSASVTAHQRQVEDTRRLGVLLRGDLDWIVMKCLEKDRTRRYDTAAALAADVRRHLAGEAVVAAPPSTAYRLRKFVLRHKGEVTAAALLFVALVGGIVGTTMGLLEARAARVAAEESKDDANRQRRIADEQRALAVAGERRAVEETENARRALARANTALAEAAYREQDAPAMLTRLHEVPEDLRGSDWTYLLQQADSSRSTVPGFHCGAAAHPSRAGVFATTTQDAFQVIDGATGAVEFEFPRSARQQSNPYRRALAISPDGERLASGSLGTGGLSVYSLRTGEPLVEWDAPELDTLAYSSDGRRLLGASTIEDVVTMWDPAAGTKLWDVRPAMRATFDPARDGEVFVLRTGESRAWIDRVDAADGRVVATLCDLRGPAAAFAIRPDGGAVAVAVGGEILTLIDARTGRTLFENRLRNQTVWFAAFTPDGRRLVTLGGRSDRQDVNVWDAASGVLLQSLLGGAGSPEGLVVHPLSSDVLVTAAGAKTWSIAQPAPAAVLTPYASAAFLGADDRCVCASPWENAAVFDVASAPPASLWASADAGFAYADASADGRVVALGRPGGDHADLVVLRAERSRTAEPDRLEETCRLTVECDVSFVRLSPDGSRLLTFIPQGRTCNLVDTRTGKRLVPGAGADGGLGQGGGERRIDDCDVISLNDVAWLGATRVVSAATIDGPRGDPASREGLVLWDFAEERQVAVAANPTVITCVAALPDAPTFAEAGADKTIRIRDSATLDVRASFRAHDDAVTALAWHPTLPFLASASADLTVKVWDLRTHRCVREIRGVLKPAAELRFGPAGTRLLAVSAGRVWVWDVADLRRVAGPK